MKGGMTIPKKTRLLTMAHVDLSNLELLRNQSVGEQFGVTNKLRLT